MENSILLVLYRLELNWTILRRSGAILARVGNIKGDLECSSAKDPHSALDREAALQWAPANSSMPSKLGSRTKTQCCSAKCLALQSWKTHMGLL